jgi:hypothetical protein
MEEATAMGRKRIPTVEEVWASTGLVEKYRTQGREEGLGQGLERGLEQGLGKGIEQGRLEVARNLITRIGLPLFVVLSMVFVLRATLTENPPGGDAVYHPWNLTSVHPG